MARFGGKAAGVAAVISSLIFMTPAFADDDVQQKDGTPTAFEDASASGFVRMSDADMAGTRGAGPFADFLAALLAASGGDNTVAVTTSSTSDPISGQAGGFTPDQTSSGDGPQSVTVSQPGLEIEANADNTGASVIVRSFPRSRSISRTRTRTRSFWFRR